MRNAYWVLVVLEFLATCSGLTACVTPKTVMSVELPPNSPMAASLRRVAVLPFQGPAGDQATLELESTLAQVSQGGQAYFTVVDRRTLQTALNELKLGDTGLVDPKTAARVGKFIGVDGIYTGTVFMPTPVRQTHTEQRSRCNDAPSKKIFSSCKSSSQYSVTCTEKLVEYTLVPRLISTATAQIIYQPSVTASRKSTFCVGQDEKPEEPDPILRAQAYAEVFRKIREDIGPHTQTFALKIKTDEGGIAQPSRQHFKDSLAFAASGRMDRACGIWAELAPNNPGNLSLAYDLAVCDEAGNRLEEALDRYTKIDQGLQRPDPDTNAALIRVKANIEASKKLAASLTARQPAPVAVDTPPAAGRKVPKAHP